MYIILLFSATCTAILIENHATSSLWTIIVMNFLNSFIFTKRELSLFYASMLK
jgi:hypothetical protein